MSEFGDTDGPALDVRAKSEGRNRPAQLAPFQLPDPGIDQMAPGNCGVAVMGGAFQWMGTPSGGNRELWTSPITNCGAGRGWLWGGQSSELDHGRPLSSSARG